MEKRFKNKYIAKSHRLQNWNYAWSGYYFITICTKNRENYFGKIKNDKIILNNIGEITKKYWLEIPNHFKNVLLDEFVIMPNHIHGIIIIDNNDNPVETQHCCVSTGIMGITGITNITDVTNANKNKSKTFYKLQQKSLPVIIRSYKSICTKIINKTKKEIFFTWQPRYYDHIIRNEKSLNNIREYIMDNPLNWKI